MKVHRKRTRENDVGDLVRKKGKSLDAISPDGQIDQLKAIWNAAVSDPVEISSGMRPCKDKYWVPNRHYRAFIQTNDVNSSCSPTFTLPCTFERYDLVGTSDINELVLKHEAMKPRDPDMRASRFKCIISPEKRLPAIFKLNTFCFNFVRSLVHPLHNFLQYHYNLHNANELEVMLMPCKGPLAEADARYHRRVVSNMSSERKSGSARLKLKSAPLQEAAYTSDGNLTGRHCYVATNNETLSENNFLDAVRNWGVAKVFDINGFTLLRTGAIGRHAEQKLLEFLVSEILPNAAPEFLAPERKKTLQPTEKALVIGERLPCAVCKLFARRYEPYAEMLPSHGHLYLSTVSTTLLFDNSLEELLRFPSAAASLLMENGSSRCLMHHHISKADQKTLRKTK
ncbi:unnamed protein product [Phytomonas sp. Hart1]|nr:unnamed protein product [Phytomonas sp. Hart1]|eukprot:CCW67353.1 unnamed protein product [Phytomonas sp. isolate Hart1]